MNNIKFSGLKKRLLRKSQPEIIVDKNLDSIQLEEKETIIDSQSPEKIKNIRSRIQNVVEWSQSPQGNNTRKLINATVNRNNWTKIKNIRSKIQTKIHNLNKSHREPESAWMSLTMTFFICCYLIYPYDFISDFIPLLGLIDDSILTCLILLMLIFDLYYNIVDLFKQEIKKYFAVLKIIFSLSIGAIASLSFIHFIIPIWQFLGL